jgi:hypothetical protein
VCSRWNGLSKSQQFWKSLPLRHWEQRDWTVRSLQLELFLVVSLDLGQCCGSGIRIRRFLGLPDTHPDPLVTSMDPDPRILPSSSKNIKKNLDLLCFFLLYDFLCLKNDKCTSVPDLDPEDPYVFGPPGSESGSVNHRYGSEVSDLYQNVTEPQP